MDGASIAAIEPKMERRPLTAPPLRASDVQRPAPEPVVRTPIPTFERPSTPTYASATFERAPAPRYPEPAAYTPPAPQPAVAAFEQEEEQADLYAAPAAAAPEPVVSKAPEPQISRPMTKIVDPSVEDAEEPLFGDAAFEDRRPQRSGFLSLFGSRPRYDAPASPAPQPTRQAPASRGGAQPAEQLEPEAQAENQEDLEIPSFLRRLAN
jgi:cell division protein FtsZ